MKPNFKIILLEKINKKNSREIHRLMKQLTTTGNKPSLHVLKKMINGPTRIFACIGKSGKIIGIIRLTFSYRLDGLCKGYIEDFVVDRIERKKGVGQALLEKTLETAKKMRIDMVHLTSNPKRVAANRLYKKIGFKPYKTNYYKYDL